MFLLIAACGDGVTGSARYWNVVMAGNSIATLTFGESVSASGPGIVAGGSTYGANSYNLFVTNGVNRQCMMLQAGGTAIIPPGGNSGDIKLTGACTGQLTEALTITLGSTASAVLDGAGNVVVPAGGSTSGTIPAPGAIGSSTGNIEY